MPLSTVRARRLPGVPRRICFPLPLSLCVAFSLLVSSGVAAQQRTRAVEPSLDSLLNTRISAPSKYAQSSAESPASVSIITWEEIRRYGYRNLQDVLESVRGFYVINDRNYPYLGTRGFSRPTDYNDRILVLVDGHTMNEQVWGSTGIGTDLPINLDAVERIEIVRGPGSVLYGTSAMFAVINIVTKNGQEIDGVIVGGGVGSGRMRQGSMAVGHSIGTRGSYSLSGLITHSDGSDLYFPEYDTPETQFGVARGLDWERSVSGLGSITWDGLTARGGYVSRDKGIPTGAFGTAFGDPRTQSHDETLWGDLSMQRQLGGSYRFSARVYADRYRNSGVWAYDAGPVDTDGGGSTDVGGEAMVVWDPSSRDRFTIGTEFRHVMQAEYHERLADGSVASDDAPFDVMSVFVQNELQLVPRLKLVTGLRFDHNSLTRHALTPRLALLVTPDSRTTLKLLYGSAFRAPSVAEADLTTFYYTRNPGLKAERAQTVELEIQRRIAAPLLFGVSLYEYRVEDLIDPLLSEDGASQQFRNVANVAAYGAEFQMEVMPAGPFSGRATYAVQRAETEPSDESLTNSPAHVATLSAAVHDWNGFRPAVTIRYESGRRTLTGSSTPAFARADLNVAFESFDRIASWLRDTRLSLRVTNAFNATYFSPGGVEHRQAAIAQDGRTFLLRLDRRF